MRQNNHQNMAIILVGVDFGMISVPEINKMIKLKLVNNVNKYYKTTRKINMQIF